MRRRKGPKAADIASRKASSTRELSGEFLEGTESTVTEIEPTAATGFKEAWNASADSARELSFDSAIDVGQDDSSVRSLNRNRIGTYLGVAVFLIGIGAIAFFGTRAFATSAGELGARASTDPERNVLVSPLADREYTDASGTVTVETFASLEDWVTISGADVEVTGGTDDPDRNVLPENVHTGPVFWAGRAHLAVVADDELLPDGSCLVISLVTTELEVVDIAGTGDCADDFAATGDRVACRDVNVIVLEVWPLNPDAVSEPKTISDVRARIELPQGQGQRTETLSLRGSLLLSPAAGTTPLVAAASTLNGGPGDGVTIEMGDLTAQCTLLDRSTVDVRLLPG